MASHRPFKLSNAPDEPTGPVGPVLDASEFERVFDQLVETHYPHLCTFALRLLGSRDAAEDTVQEVLLKIWNRRTADSLREPVPYLYRAVRNQCLMVLRSERRWNTVEINPQDPLHAASPDDDHDLFDLQEAIARAIDDLPERTRLVFTMHRQQDLTYGEIARVLGISVKTVETQMTRALRALRQRLDKFFSVGVAVLAVTQHWTSLFR